MKIVGMLPVHNDEDIISEVIKQHIFQGIDLVVLDNSSTDNTLKICKKFLGHGILNIEQFESKIFDISHIFRKLYDMALFQSPDWVILIGSDEFLESGINTQNLKNAILQADVQGYNLIQFDRFDFFMTDNDKDLAESFKEKLPYYSYQGDYVYRAWKYFSGIGVEQGGTHYPSYPQGYKYKISPNKFVLRHYPLRTKEQAIKKKKSRMERIANTAATKIGWHKHYEQILENDFSEKMDHKLLTKYKEDNKWNFEKKFTPYTPSINKKREDVFTKDGDLKIKNKSFPEFILELRNLRKEFRLKKEELRNRNIELRNKNIELRNKIKCAI